MKGTCNHHDLGALGAAFNVRALERQLVILQEMGDNALRTSHNPPAPELLDLADRMGFVVMVEAFDCWKQGKTGGDYSRIFDEWHARDLQAMVRRERNHPSVIMWSIGNEIAEQNGPELAQHLRDIVHAEDPTRPVTAGCNNPRAGTNGFQTAVDIFGLNYSLGSYRHILEHPGNEQKPVYTSESSSCVSSRGEYFFPVKRGQELRGELPGVVLMMWTPRPGPSRRTRSLRPSTATRRSSASSSGPVLIIWASRRPTTMT